MKNMFYFLVILGICASGYSQNRTTDTILQQKLKEFTADFNGTAGIYVYHLGTGQEAGINEDSIFPTASIIKVPILIALFNKIEKGDLSLNDTLQYSEERVYGGSGVAQFFKDSTQIDLRTLAGLMITYSDNVTSLWNQELAGTGEEINRIMEELGLENTRVNSRTKGREGDWELYGWGQTTPREMAGLLVKMRKRELVSAAASDEMYRMMTNSSYTDYSLSQIPPYVQTAAKQGMVNKSRSELVMVNAPGGDYVFYIATKNNEDTSWEYDNEAYNLQRKVSAYLWNYFEPESGWKPAEGAEELLTGRKE